ncbi:MAG: DEAD/DEAH box helicase, partial [Streptomycetaceae bacterium]|nr:DEAD/DEAH box helicase [Streptomycetaceae bacterium]
MPPTSRPQDNLLDRLLAAHGRPDRVTHVRRIPARRGRPTEWPEWARREVVDAFRAAGIDHPWEHQARAASAAASGRSVVLATGTASGKSMAYLLPVLTALLEGTRAPNGRGATALYLSPTKALAADQLRAVDALRAAETGLDAVRTATYDGDTPAEVRRWVRAHAAYVLTNPDMLHRSLLPAHRAWSAYLKALKYIVIDECHTYRGVFGSHVAQVLRRLRRICRRYGADPVFVLASATVSDPAAAAARLIGSEPADVEEVTDDASPRGGLTFALWEPPLTDFKGERGAPVRRTATAEAADLLGDLVLDGVRTVAFVRSRRGAEVVRVMARDQLERVDPGLADQVATYRAGYLPEERRDLEQALHDGRLRGVAATTALELGVDISGLDAVLIAGYPGTRASQWQQAGRAGRAGQEALAVLIARDDPLDTFLVHHPEALFDRPVEATVLDPDNPYVLAPHLCAAAAELPLEEDDLPLFGPVAAPLLPGLVKRGLLRRRSTGWYWTSPERATDLTDIRGAAGAAVREDGTGRVLGTVDGSAAYSAVHTGAVYLHQGETYLVRELVLDDAVALVRRANPDWTTSAREKTDIRVLDEVRSEAWGRARLCFGSVEVTSRVVSYQRRRILTGQILGEHRLDLPAQSLRTRAVWWTVTPEQVAEASIDEADLPGAAHAAEHASIGLLPLFATCDRWDIGGVSTALHPDTGLPTVFVYDGHPGGAGFAERAYSTAPRWLRAT